MTSFVYLVSTAFHTSVTALRKCTHTSRKKLFWLRVQPLVHRLLHLFVEHERLAFHRLFEWSKNMKVTGVEVWRVRQMWKTLKGQSWIVATVEQAVWDRALSRWSKTPVLRRPRRLDLIAGRLPLYLPTYLPIYVFTHLFTYICIPYLSVCLFVFIIQSLKVHCHSAS